MNRIDRKDRVCVIDEKLDFQYTSSAKWLSRLWLSRESIIMISNNSRYSSYLHDVDITFDWPQSRRLD